LFANFAPGYNLRWWWWSEVYLLFANIGPGYNLRWWWSEVYHGYPQVNIYLSITTLN
jgi:hypothetical protein